MTYIFEFKVVGPGIVKIWRNGVAVAEASEGEQKIVYFEKGDIFKQDCFPVQYFIQACDQFGICTTNPAYQDTIAVVSLYVFVTYTFSAGTPPPFSISSIDVIASDLVRPQQRTVKVVGYGSGAYQVKEGTTVIASRNLVNGQDIFNIDNISYASHTYCTSPAAASGCKTFTVSKMGYDCFNSCSAPYVGGQYTTQAECQEMCAPQCDKISPDTWKPATTTPETGKSLPFSLRSANPNKDFLITNGQGALGTVIITGKTDSTGCYEGEIPAFNDGTYVLYMCYTFLGVGDYFHPITIRWGAKPLIENWQLVIIYIAVFLGVIYLAGTYIKSR